MAKANILLMPPEKRKNGQNYVGIPLQVLRKFTYIPKALFEPTSLYFLHIKDKSWWFCLHFLLNPIPHSQAMSIIKHVLPCASISFCFVLSLHCLDAVLSDLLPDSALFLIRTTCSGHGPSQVLHLPDGCQKRNGHMV